MLAQNLQEHCKSKNVNFYKDVAVKKLRHFNVNIHILHINTLLYQLVRGYTAPEYAIHGQLSVKADTYSFGVVVLEIISGQKSSELRDDVDGEFLLQRVRNFIELH